jgi:hypothetical protein
MEWKTPEEVQTSAFADCKGKAVALYNAMNSRGPFRQNVLHFNLRLRGRAKISRGATSILYAKNQFLGGRRVASRL